MTSEDANPGPCTPEIEMTSGQKGRPRIRWRNGYPVLLLAEPGQPSRLPAQRFCLGSAQARPGPDGDDVFIIGERSSGVRDLLEWWCDTLNNTEYSWLLARGDTWDRDFFKTSKSEAQESNASEPEAKEAETFPDKIRNLVEQFGSPEEKYTLDRAKILMKLDNELQQQSSIQQRFTLIFRHLSKLPDPVSGQCAEALAVIRDHDHCNKLRFVVADNRLSIYQPRGDASGFQRFCFTCRPAHWDTESIEVLANQLLSDQENKSIGEETIAEILDFTGGQPLLVHHLLQRLQRLEQTEIKPEDVVYASRQMRANPPPQTNAWSEDLHQILTDHSQLIEAMRRYAAGETLGPARFPPPAAERALFINGWLRLNEDYRWGMTSEMHRRLAMPILDQFLGKQ
jgi:hypothetical protein